MSTSYGYLCVTDGSASPTSLANVGYRVLPALASVRLQLKEVMQCDHGGWLEFDFLGHHDDGQQLIEWLLQHAEHQLMLRDEYGHISELDVPLREMT